MKTIMALCVTSLMFFGCGSDSDDNDEGTGGSPAVVENNDSGTVDPEGEDAGAAGAQGTDECGTVHTVTSTDDSSDIDVYMDFSPEDLTISAGDCVEFVMSNEHNAVEVSQETYESRGIEALDGGFNVTFGGTQTIRFDTPGTHYYICIPHVRMDMVGTITVE